MGHVQKIYKMSVLIVYEAGGAETKERVYGPTHLGPKPATFSQF